MTIIDAQIWGRQQLRRHRCPGTDPEREAAALLGQVLKASREELAVRPTGDLTAAQEHRFRGLIDRRLRHEPLAYILGTAPFLDFEVSVAPATLIPRPATETLALAAVAELKRMVTAADEERQPRPLAVDLGTGSGAIALALARSVPQAEIVATDQSVAALKIARKNARQLGLANKIKFLGGDLLNPVVRRFIQPQPRVAARRLPDASAKRRTEISPAAAPSRRPLLIIANLPYIPSADWISLPPDIRRFEPKSALVSGRDGLRHYRRLIRQLTDRRLTAAAAESAETAMFLEILPEQFPPLSDLLSGIFPAFHHEAVTNDSGVIVGLAALSRSGGQ